MARAGAGDRAHRSPTGSSSTRRRRAEPGEQGIRVELDVRDESIVFKIREAELAEALYMLVVGGREADERTVSVREHRGGDAGAVSLGEFVERIRALAKPPLGEAARVASE